MERYSEKIERELAASAMNLLSEHGVLAGLRAWQKDSEWDDG